MSDGNLVGDGRTAATRDAPSATAGASDQQTMDASSPELSSDDVFHLLQTSRRRDVLTQLREADNPLDIRTLSERIAAREHDTTVETLDSTQRQRVYISLYQTHLPKLAEHGVIDYEKDRGIVSRRPEADELDPYLELSADAAQRLNPWPRRYAAVTALGLVALAATQLVSTPLSSTGIATAVLGVLGLTALAHLRTAE
ncbi:hypothetical protein OB905_00940 [Halobacteria archaeon AArc-dxtr1]|nr:hypothetical protein [Halobacteria archaeon AArc-dxtr1]